MPFKKAIKPNGKLRMMISIAGSGKTYTSLTSAIALANGKPIALIDTEYGSASKKEVFVRHQELSECMPAPKVEHLASSMTNARSGHKAMEKGDQWEQQSQ
jgi:hypothetical protein